MADQLPYCIHCGTQQLNADSKFCRQCGQPIVPTATPGRRQRPPWAGPVLVSAVILLVAAVVFARLLTGGPTASKTAAATPAPPAVAGTATPATAVQSLGVQSTPPTTVVALGPKTPTPFSTETPQPTPTVANITPEPVKLTQLAWSPDGKLLAVGSATGVYLYDTTTWQEARFVPVNVSVPSSLEDGVDDLAFSFDGALLGAAGRRVQVWRVADGGLAYEIQASGQLAASPTEGLWATAGDSYNPGNLRLWRASDGQLVREIRTGVQFVASIAFSSDGRLLASGPMVDGSPTVWRTADGQRAGQLNWGQAAMFGWVDFAFRPNTSTVVAVGTDDVLLVWDTTSGGMRLLTGPNDMTTSPVVNRVSYVPDGSLFATSHSAGPGRQGGSVQLWNADGARGQAWQIAALPKDIAFSPDSKLLAATDEQTLYVWRLDDKTLLNQIQPVWHQGALPTPTPMPTPYHSGIEAPSDWKDYYPQSDRSPYRFKLSAPPTWYVRNLEGSSIGFSDASPLSDSLTYMYVEVTLNASCAPALELPGSPSSVDFIRQQHFSYAPAITSVFVDGGKWPHLIPASYAEFDTTNDYYAPGSMAARYDVPWVIAHRKTREIELFLWNKSLGCVRATLDDELEDISDQDRLDLSYVLASIRTEDAQNPFPTITPTVAWRPTPAPRPAEPLKIVFDAKTYPDGDQGAADVTVEIKDAFDNLAKGVLPYLICSNDSCLRLRFPGGGRCTTTVYSHDLTDRTVTVEVRWNEQVIAKQEFVISWR